MSSSELLTIVDDSFNDSFIFGPQSWTRSALPLWFNATSQSPMFAMTSGTPRGTLEMRFQGTSVSFYGNTPAGSVNETFHVSIDGKPSYSATYDDPNPPSYRQWYQSPLLDEGAHNIILFNLPGDLSLDFAVVSVGESTPLNGTIVIADNDDPGFFYTGAWTRSLDAFNSGPQLDGRPYHNSTHRACDIGSSFLYEFSGNSAAIYGIFNWANLGKLTLTLTLDGQPLVKTYTVRSDTQQFVEELGEQENFLFYEYSFLQAGNHTLIVNITECVNQTFVFDYITYRPSFATLASMPSLTPMNSTLNTNAVQPSNIKNNHTGIIAASVSAATAVFLFLCGIIFCMGRRKRKTDTYEAVHPFPTVPSVNPYRIPDVPPIGRIPLHAAAIASRESSSRIDRTMANEASQPFLINIRAPLLSDSHTVKDAFVSTRSVIRGMEGQPGSILPPSYDETTRGQPLRQATRTIRR